MTRGIGSAGGRTLPVSIPAQLSGMRLILSLSGGKDSVAAGLFLRESGIDFIAVHARTKWEAQSHNGYMEKLERVFDIHYVGKPGGMPAQLLSGRFPGRQQRWCTQELKIEPIMAFHREQQEVYGETVAVIGIRRQEATPWNTRRTDPEVEYLDGWDAWAWRCILGWTVEDVLAIHARHGVPVNPLYERGHERVGCYPCIFAGKEELALLAKHEPKRIDEIAEYEELATGLRTRRNRALAAAGKKPRYKNERATFFQTQRKGLDGIREVVEWARTDYGGRQWPLLPPPPTGGCMRWGLCEFPIRADLEHKES